MKVLNFILLGSFCLTILVGCAEAPPDASLFSVISCSQSETPAQSECIEAKAKDKERIVASCENLRARIEKTACNRRMASRGCRKLVEERVVTVWLNSQNPSDCEGETLDLQGRIISLH